MRHDEIYQRIDRPWGEFDRSLLGDEFRAELATASRLWFACGYRPGICTYLNFFLLRDFIITHDDASPERFASFWTMAKSFYETDVFIRVVTDSGSRPSGGISSSRARALLSGVMERHRVLSIPDWMMTYFGWNLLECVEQQCAPLSDEQRRLHLAYMTKTYRIMGVPFSDRRELMEEFARSVERTHAGVAPQLERHARNILLLGEMVSVSSHPSKVAAMLPRATRAIYEPIASRVRPGPARRAVARGLGRLLMKRAVGAPRIALPVEE